MLAGIIEREPDFSRLPPATPPAIRRLLRRSLEKDRKRRLSDIADARIEIDEALTTPSADASVVTLAIVQPAGWRRALPWAVAFGAAAIAAAVLALWAPWQTAPPPAPLRLTADLGADASLATAVGQNATIGTSVVLSPDGALFAFVAQDRHRNAAALCPPARAVAGDAARRNRRRRQSVLLARRSVDRVLRTGQAEKDSRHGWRRRHALRRRECPRRKLGRGRHDRVYAVGRRIRALSVACVVGWREAGAASEARRRGGHPALAAGAARRQGGALHGKHRRRRIRECESRGATAAQRARARSSSAAGTTAGICPAVIWSTSTTERSLPRRSISRAWK